jgi:hypothetical protein
MTENDLKDLVLPYPFAIPKKIHLKNARAFTIYNGEYSILSTHQGYFLLLFEMEHQEIIRHNAFIRYPSIEELLEWTNKCPEFSPKLDQYRLMKMIQILNSHELVVSDYVRPSHYHHRSERRFRVRITEKGKKLLHYTLATVAINNPASISPKVSERLSNEGGYDVRQLLEAHLPPNHPILTAIDNRLQIDTKKGFSLQL